MIERANMQIFKGYKNGLLFLFRVLLHKKYQLIKFLEIRHRTKNLKVEVAIYCVELNNPTIAVLRMQALARLIGSLP